METSGKVINFRPSPERKLKRDPERKEAKVIKLPHWVSEKESTPYPRKGLLGGIIEIMLEESL